MKTHGIVTKESGVKRPQPKGRTKLINLWPRLVGAVPMKLMTMLLPLLTMMAPLFQTPFPLTFNNTGFNSRGTSKPEDKDILNAKHTKPLLTVRRFHNSARRPKTAIPLTPHTIAKRKQGRPKGSGKKRDKTDQLSFSSLPADVISSIEIVNNCGWFLVSTHCSAGYAYQIGNALPILFFLDQHLGYFV